MKEGEIVPVNELEAMGLPSMCEIRFDAIVTIYESGVRKTNTPNFGKTKNPPQWFRSFNKITLEEIKHSNEAVLGARIKEMFKQMEAHIYKYENNKI